MKYFNALIVLLISTFVSATAFANQAFQPQYQPRLTLPRLEGNIKIDGKLDDAGWHNAAEVGGFCENNPGDQVKPPVETRAFITYDDSRIYVAFVCFDDREKIRASYSERDQIGGDDNVGFFIDTYGDGLWAYFFNVNPYGIQADALWSKNKGEDASYDLIWESMGLVTDSGYQVEMSIPFSSLRFPNADKQTWKAEFWRNHQYDTRRQYSWSAYDRNDNCFACQWGTISGIENVAPGRGIEILPSVVGFQSGELSNYSDPLSKWNSDKIDGNISLGVKYPLTSSMTAEATLNPDFSQVESDATQIDVNTTIALSYPEKRPFFQEGSDMFKSWFDVIYTRSINDPIFAGKLTGRSGRSSIAYIGAMDEHTPVILPFEESSAILSNGKSFSNILRARQGFGNNSQVGLILTDRRLDGGGSGSVLGMDGELRISRSNYFQWSMLASHTDEPDDTALTSGLNQTVFDNGRHTAGFDGESFWGHGIYASVGRAAKHEVIDISYFERSPRFRTDNGFEPTNNSRLISFYSGYNFYPNGKIVKQIEPYFRMGKRWNFQKQPKREYVSFELESRMTASSNIHSAYTVESEFYGGLQFDRTWLLHMCGSSDFSRSLGVSGSINYGDQIARRENPPTLGREFTFYIGGYIRPFERMLIEPQYVYQKSRDMSSEELLYEAYTLRAKINYQLNRELSFRLITQYNDYYRNWEIDPLITYQLNPFTLIYAGSTHDFHDYHDFNDTGFRQTSRQFFFKVQYLVQM
jgi:hypothetical protein